MVFAIIELKTSSAEKELVTASIELPGSVAFGDAVVQAMSRRVGVYIEQTDPRTVSSL